MGEGNVKKKGQYGIYIFIIDNVEKKTLLQNFCISCE